MTRSQTAVPRIATRLALLLLAGLPLTGCSIIPDPKDAPTIYAPEAKAKADPAWPSVAWQLATTRPGAARVLDSSRIAVSPVPGELQVYKGAVRARTSCPAQSWIRRRWPNCSRTGRNSARR